MRSIAAVLVVLNGLAWASPAVSAASADDNWSRVTKLAPGAEIILTIKGAQPAVRYVISTDESDLVTLDLTDARLSGSARDALRDLAENHPDYFAAAKMGETIEEDTVRMAPTGVFVATRRVASVEQIADTVGRTSVQRIQQRRTRFAHVVHDVGVGFLIGATTGIAIAFLRFGQQLGAAGSFFGGEFGVGGAEIGAIHGAAQPETLELIYEAPRP